ncbi:PREDICTED: histone-lysine N-methyltransferase SETMAR-like [Acromyrmex echinatior]|uniref:histone-lysine N-methyltransferase SETMAR-like n=1 Tax=Acromyrmex echinatior TaxID=103372 RepID=UPI000580BF6D|nr:PREDICTED: histone-lysine N-methyltransferase SETMAR-like [Acromyrmex echinatior]
MEIVESDRHVSTISIAQELNIVQKTVWNHLNKAGYKKKLDVWVPYELTQKNLMDRISICESLLNRNKINLFLKRMVTDDEKESYYELLLCGQTLTSDLYCQQLDRLKEVIAQKRPALANRRGIVFHQDNTRPHTSIVTRQKLRELGWEVFMHPPYTPDLAPSDYHLFLSMVNDFAGEKFSSREACENQLPHGKSFLPIGTRVSMREA